MVNSYGLDASWARMLKILCGLLIVSDFESDVHFDVFDAARMVVHATLYALYTSRKHRSVVRVNEPHRVAIDVRLSSLTALNDDAWSAERAQLCAQSPWREPNRACQFGERNEIH